jgi:hypothetical protein
MSDEARGADSEACLEMLATCCEAKRLERARTLAAKVGFQVADAELVIAAVANYNVVLDIKARRIQHGCRDFQGQAAERRLCKHVAAAILALGADACRTIATELAEGVAAASAGEVAPWSFEVITRFTPGRG